MIWGDILSMILMLSVSHLLPKVTKKTKALTLRIWKANRISGRLLWVIRNLFLQQNNITSDLPGMSVVICKEIGSTNSEIQISESDMASHHSSDICQRLPILPSSNRWRWDLVRWTSMFRSKKKSVAVKMKLEVIRVPYREDMTWIAIFVCNSAAQGVK